MATDRPHVTAERSLDAAQMLMLQVAVPHALHAPCEFAFLLTLAAGAPRARGIRVEHMPTSMSLTPPTASARVIRGS